ncbi:MAG TPA: class I SAM-dependent methyltransferase [Kofleriaceae bacterium]|nr:class I SAM-dependent methyltransferase [Kofleriaceae bacterium]
MAGPNADMIEYWNGDGAKRWIAARDRMDRSMAAIHDALIAFAEPRRGERVLDVGCGCGTTTIELARRTGVVATGIDVSAPMVAVARERAGKAASFVVADASSHAFEPAFQLVFSRFGVMFFADPVAAFANIRRAVKPDGRIAFACWRALEHNAWAGVPLAAARPLLPAMPPPDPLAPGPFAFADGERVCRILAGAGFQDASVAAHASSMWLGDTLESAVDEVLSIGPLARAAGELPEATRAQIRERVRAALEPYVAPDGVALPAAVWLAGARA